MKCKKSRHILNVVKAWKAHYLPGESDGVMVIWFVYDKNFPETPLGVAFLNVRHLYPTRFCPMTDEQRKQQEVSKKSTLFSINKLP